jgi:adenine-specific DNA-methyltransferase
MEGAVPVFPIRDDGKHMNWGLIGPSLKNAVDLGFVRVSKSSNEYQPYNFSYITVPSIKKVEDGIYRVSGVKNDGSKIVVIPGGKTQRGTTAWKKNLHDANAYGSQVVGTFIQDKKFPFPKSIYAVFDTLQLFLANNVGAD